MFIAIYIGCLQLQNPWLNLTRLVKETTLLTHFSNSSVTVKMVNAYMSYILPYYLSFMAFGSTKTHSEIVFA
jgi:hypothetical protein